MYDVDLTQIILEFTPISPASKSVLDLIFVNGSISSPTVTIADEISDHKLVFMALHFSLPNLKKVTSVFHFSAADDGAVLVYRDLCLRD